MSVYFKQLPYENISKLIFNFVCRSGRYLEGSRSRGREEEVWGSRKQDHLYSGNKIVNRMFTITRFSILQ